MKLISLVNSGESLEKVISLIVMAYNSNYEFYSSFDEVVVFYSPNIIKSKKDLKIVGTVKSLLEVGILKLFYNCENFDELYAIRNNILDVLLQRGKISYRQREKLNSNKELFLKVVVNLSWLEVFPDIEEMIIKYISKEYNNLKLINISSYCNIIDAIQINPYFQDFEKIYFYDYNGSTIMKKVNKASDYRALLKIEQNSIYYTYNVYGFMLIVYKYFAESENIILGYRQMKNTYRKTYAKALNYILKNCYEVLVEPRNINYNNELGKQPFSLGDNERCYYATYNIFSQIVRNILKNKS